MSSERSGPIEQRATQSQRGPSKVSVLTLVVVLGLMGLLVWSFYPQRIRLTPAPLVAQPAGCSMAQREFIPTNVTEVADHAVTSLPAPIRNRVLFRINMDPCTCGCLESIVACRMANPRCQASKKLIQEEVAEERMH